MYEYQAKVDKVVDGDTLDIILDLGFCVTMKQRIRLARIDAPERFTIAGKSATTYLKKLILGKEVIIKTEKVGKYGRYIADVYKVVEPGKKICVNDLLVETGNAVYRTY